MWKHLKLFKSWVGNLVSLEDKIVFGNISKFHPDQNEVIICTELIYLKESNKS